MLIATHLLSAEICQKARSAGVKVFLYNEITFVPPESPENGEIFFNCNTERVEGSWYGWRENERIAESFKKKYPALFRYGTYDLTLAVKKALFWSNFRTAFLWYAYEKHFKEHPVFYIDPLFETGLKGLFLRYIKQRYLPAPRARQRPAAEVKDYRYALHIRNDFQLGLYQDILRKVKNDARFRVFADSRVDRAFAEALELGELIETGDNVPFLPFPYIGLAGLNAEDRYVLDTLLRNWKELSQAVHTAETISHPGLKSVLINEAENGVYGATVSEIFRQNGTVVYNTMNGLKSGEAQDAHINFDYWFVWDREMKQLLMKANGLPGEKLLVSGHLVEDLIRRYEYQGSIPFDPARLHDKKVISLFSVKGKRFVKLEAMRILYRLLRENADLVLLIRPHPSEKPEDYILPDEPMDNVHFMHYHPQNQNETLHDQLLISDLAIVFGSTVALEAKWMGVPCITFEVRDESLIYCADGKNIVHVVDSAAFETALRIGIQEKKRPAGHSGNSVSDFILNRICSSGPHED